MGMRVVQESLASCVPGRLAFSEICEAFLEQVLCKHLKKSSQKRQGRTWPGREHGLPGAFGKDAGSWGALNMRPPVFVGTSGCRWKARWRTGQGSQKGGRYDSGDPGSGGWGYPRNITGAGRGRV